MTNPHALLPKALLLVVSLFAAAVFLIKAPLNPRVARMLALRVYGRAGFRFGGTARGMSPSSGGFWA